MNQTTQSNNWLFKENLKKFAKQNPEWEEMLMHLVPLRLTLCRSGHNDLNIKQVVPRAAYYYSFSDAHLEAKIWFQGLNLAGEEVLFIYGLGTGIYFSSLKAWLHQNPKSMAVFFEDDPEVLRLFLETQMAKEMLDHPQVILKAFQTIIPGNNDYQANSWGKFRIDFEEIFWMFQRKRCRFSALLFYGQEKPDVCKQLLQQIQINLEEISYSLTEFSPSFHFLIAKNSYQNLLSLSEGYLLNALEGEFSEVPALICGAGSSIDSQLSLIDSLKDKALIIAAGTGMNVLTKAHIRPHLMGAIDPTEIQVSRSLTQFGFEVPTFFASSFSSEAKHQLQSTWLYTSLNFNIPFMQWFENELGIVPSLRMDIGTSTSHSCFLTAKHLGCNPLFLVGMDLSYKADKRYSDEVVSHPTDSLQAKEQVRHISEHIINAADVFGAPVKTTYAWMYEARCYFRHLTAAMKGFNASEGISIPGIPHLSLKEASHRFFPKQYDLLNWMHAACQAATFSLSKKRIKEALEKWTESLKKVQVLLEKQDGKYLQEEAYAYLLKIFDEVWSKAHQLPLWIWKTHPESFTKEEIDKGKQNVLSEKYAYLLKIASMHLEFAEKALKEINLEVDEEDLDSFFPKELRLKKEFSYEGSNLHGPSRIYSNEGQLLAESHFIDGKRTCATKQYYLNGALFSDLYFKEGKQEGMQFYYYQSGALKSELSYHLGKLHGQVRLYFPNSYLKRQLHFEEGILKGIERCWEESGRLAFEVEHG